MTIHLMPKPHPTYLDNRLAQARTYLAGRTREAIILEIEDSVDGDPAETLLLFDDNARLRALLKAHEFDNFDGCGCSSCWELWPLVDQRDTAWDHTHEHHPDCPAFTPNGEVK